MGTPCSAYDKTCGMMYFGRMLDKNRLFAEGKLRQGFSREPWKGCGQLVRQLSASVIRLVEGSGIGGGTDEEILAWYFEKGRTLADTDLLVWNSFVAKLGWKDLAAPRLRKFKEASGLGNRDDLQTMVEYFEVDEGRKP